MLTEVKLAHVWLKVNIFSSNCIDVVIIKHSEPKIKHKNKKKADLKSIEYVTHFWKRLIQSQQSGCYSKIDTCFHLVVGFGNNPAVNEFFN